MNHVLFYRDRMKILCNNIIRLGATFDSLTMAHSRFEDEKPSAFHIVWVSLRAVYFWYHKTFAKNRIVYAKNLLFIVNTINFQVCTLSRKKHLELSQNQTSQSYKTATPNVSRNKCCSFICSFVVKLMQSFLFRCSLSGVSLINLFNNHAMDN